MTNFLLPLERWVKYHLRSKRTRRIEEKKRSYLYEYQDISSYITKLKTASQKNEDVVKALQQKLGL